VEWNVIIIYITLYYFKYSMYGLSEGLCHPSFKSPVVDEERMKPVGHFPLLW